MSYRQKRPYILSTFLKKRGPRVIEIYSLQTKKRVCAAELPAEIDQSSIGFFCRKKKRHLEKLWVQLKDGRTLYFSVKTGRLLAEVPRLRATPAMKRRLRARAKEIHRWKNIRYAVVNAASRRCTLFYNFADGGWYFNHIDASSMFRDYLVAQAVLTSLNQERRKDNRRAGSRVYGRLQMVEFKKTKNGGKILSSVMSGMGRYKPMLYRTRREEGTSK